MTKLEEYYTYWTLELYDQKNGIRGGGGLGILAADTRRIADTLDIPLILMTPFYPVESHQKCDAQQSKTTLKTVAYQDFGFKKIGNTSITCNHQECPLDIIEKRFNSTRLLCVTEPNFGELYSGAGDSNRRLYQQVALGFGGYQALKITDITPSIFQINESAALFAAIAHLDHLTLAKKDFQKALQETRQRVLYTNHTLVDAAEAAFSLEQFEQFVFSNIKSGAVVDWLKNLFHDDFVKISTIAIELSALRSGVSRLHAKVANYHDSQGKKVKFQAITNGIDMENWVLPKILDFYKEQGIIDSKCLPTPNYTKQLHKITYQTIINLKNQGRDLLNKTLKQYPDHNGKILKFNQKDLIFTFKRRFVSYKRPDLPFGDPEKLANILERHNAHYILTGRVHANDEEMKQRFHRLIQLITQHPVLKQRVHYLPDYDETIATALATGSNITLNTPIVGLEACGTSWEKDIANLTLIISTHDGGVADATPDDYLNVSGKTETQELLQLYKQMEIAATAWEDAKQLELWTHKQLSAFLPVISGTRMMQDYLALFDKSML